MVIVILTMVDLSMAMLVITRWYPIFKDTFLRCFETICQEHSAEREGREADQLQATSLAEDLQLGLEPAAVMAMATSYKWLPGFVSSVIWLIFRMGNPP